MSKTLSSLLLSALLAVLSFTPAQAQHLQRYEFESPHMGTLFRVVLYASGDSVARAAAHSSFERIEILDSLFSDYKENSELSRLSSRSGTGRFIKVSAPLFEVLNKAQILAKQTGGAFDVTVGPYVKLWREMWSDEKPRLPDKTILGKVSQSVGYQHIKLDRSSLSVFLGQPNMLLDLGGIAKGYAADEALRILREFGIHSALVDAGGDITVGNAPPGEEGWRVSIPIYSKQGGLEYMTLRLANRAVATSGDLFRHIEIEGKRYSHIIDPHTGLGLTNRSSVTIVAPDGITADSYASAVSVMGPHDGIQFIEEKGHISAHVEYYENGAVLRTETADFNTLREK